MGLVNLKYVDHIISVRKTLSEHYDKFLSTFQGVKPVIFPETSYNYAYYPLIFNEEKLLVLATAALNQNWIHPRRYFFPSLEDLPYIHQKSHCEVADSISRRALCLPLFDTLTTEEIDMIFRIILRAQNN